MAQTTDDHQHRIDDVTMTAGTSVHEGQPPLVARGVVKSFANVAVLRGVDLTVAPGEIHALLGSNGSGKSTFVKLVTGTYSADAGTEITLDGQAFGADLSPADARATGVRTVHQESPLIGQMTVAEHFGLDRGFPTGRGMWVRRRPLDQMAKDALERVGADIHPNTYAKDLLAAERAQVSLALAMTDIQAGHGLLVLDEATALLPAPDARPILERVAALAAEGVGVLMVTHRLSEVTAYCHNVTVLRDGAVVLSCPVGETDHDTMVNAMVGRTADSTLAVHEARVKKVMDSGVAPIISVRELAGAGIEDVSFDVRPGEILGFAGIVGSGASEVGRMVTGAEPTTGGTIVVAGRDAPRRWTPRAAMSAGIAFVPQDRHAEGGVLTLSLRDNVSLPRYSEYWRKAGAERADVEGVITDLDVQPPLADKPFAEFSGGNQQKALLGKWLLLDPKVLVLDDPTYGVDPNAREILLHAVAEVADRGAAVIVISTEPEQLARICDRVLVMRSGRISTELTDDNINEVEISLACFS